MGYAAPVGLELSGLVTSNVVEVVSGIDDAKRGEKAASTYFTTELWGRNSGCLGDGGVETCCTVFPSNLIKGWLMTDTAAAVGSFGLTASKESLVLNEGLGIELGLGLDSKDA